MGTGPATQKRAWWSLAVAALATACAPATEPVAQPEAPKAEQAPAEKAATPRRGASLSYAMPGKVTSCYTYKADEASTNQILDHTVYETLVEFDYNVKDFRSDLEVLPGLAERWDQPDPTSYLFHLRKGVKWHDGKPFTADDVLATRQAVTAQNFRGAAVWKPFKTVEKVDDYTLRLTTERPAPMVLVTMAQTSDAHVLPKHILEAGTMEKDCIGTGPFRMVTWSAIDGRLERNQDYYRKDADGTQYPYLDGIKFIANMARPAIASAMAAQEVDLHNFNLVKDYQAFIKQQPNLVTNQQYWSHHNYSGLFNLNRKPFDDIRVRQALSLVLDRHRANQLAWAGEGKFSLPVVPGIKEGWGISQEELLKMPGWRKGAELKQDQAEGQRLLKEAGLGGGFKVDLLYIKTWSGAPWAEVLPGLYKPFGVEIELRGLDGASVIKEGREANYDVWLRLVANFDPLLRTDEFFYSKSGQAESTGITDVGQDALIDRLRVELDVKQQKDLVRKIQKIVVDQHWVFNLGDFPIWNVTQPWVNGYRSTFSVQPFLVSTREVWFDLDKLPAKRKS